jgi:hypothetical protein
MRFFTMQREKCPAFYLLSFGHPSSGKHAPSFEKADNAGLFSTKLQPPERSYGGGPSSSTT